MPTMRPKGHTSPKSRAPVPGFGQVILGETRPNIVNRQATKIKVEQPDGEPQREKEINLRQLQLSQGHPHKKVPISFITTQPDLLLKVPTPQLMLNLNKNAHLENLVVQSLHCVRVKEP